MTMADDVIELPNAGVPADHGLSSLGLLMQLAGSAFAALATLLAALMLFTLGLRPGDGTIWVLVVLGLCTVRSLLHRAAGAALLYGRRQAGGPRGGPLAGIRRYITLGLGHSVLVSLIMHAKLEVPGPEALGYGLGLAVWPLVLALVLASGALARVAAELPYGEDKGFEAASILMAVLGAIGALASLAALLAAVGSDRRDLEGAGFLAAVAFVVLAVRSCIHLAAGLSGLRETSIDRSVELANRYSSFGVLSAFGAAGAWLLGETSPPGIALVACACWLLLAWPLIIRRFFWDRQFADLLAGDRVLHRRAPDAGLTGLGWLLLGHAALTAAFLAPRLLADMPRVKTGVDLFLAIAGGSGTGSPWLAAGVLALELWAGCELVRMGRLHRVAAQGYGAAAVLATLYLMEPFLSGLLGPRGFEGDAWTAIALAVIAGQLVIPISAVLLAGRRVAPAARARYRRTTR